MRGKQQGYTILEVLIFVAVSAFIFISAMVAINGRQQQVQFTQGVREFEAKIQDIMNDISTGYYPTNQTIRCQVTGGVVSFNFNSGNTETLGGNSDCIYAGKVIQVLPSGTNSDIRLIIYNLAGKRYADTDNTLLADTLSEVAPKMVSTTTVTEEDSAEEYLTRFGLKITKLTEVTAISPSPSFGALAIMPKLGGGGVNADNSQAQQVSVGTIFGTAANQDESTLAGFVNQLKESPVASNGYFNQTSAGVVICLVDASNANRKASVTITSSGARLQIDDYQRSCDA